MHPLDPGQSDTRWDFYMPLPDPFSVAAARRMIRSPSRGDTPLDPFVRIDHAQETGSTSSTHAQTYSTMRRAKRRR